MTIDLLGFADAGCAPTLTTTTDVTAPVAGDTWSKDCAGGVAGTGTDWDSKFMNRLLQQVRVGIRMSGVPLSNSYDNMLSWAMQSGFVNWLQYGFGGTANALTGAAPNAPIAVEGGTLVCGVVETSANTGAVTFNWSGLGAEPVLRDTGEACTGGEIVNNMFLMLRWDGGSWRIVSPPPLSWLLPQLSGIDVQTFDATGTWTKPANFAAASRVLLEIWGAGMGGLVGGGGNGGNYERFETYLGNLPSSVTCLVGAGSAGVSSGVPAYGGSSTFAYGLYSNAFTALGGGVNTPFYGFQPSSATTTEPTLVPAQMGMGGYGGDANFHAAGNSLFGGGGGCGWNATATAAGSSVFGGAGGGFQTAGSVPGGGGGATDTSGTAAGNGAHGRIRVTTLMG